LAVTANLSVASIDKTAKLVRTEGLRFVNPIEVQEYRRIYAGQKVCIRQAQLLHIAQGELVEDLSEVNEFVP
jgi:3-dehydroquinate synthase class II